MCDVYMLHQKECTGRENINNELEALWWQQKNYFVWFYITLHYTGMFTLKQMTKFMLVLRLSVKLIQGLTGQYITE
jgi:hypothetical protein